MVIGMANLMVSKYGTKLANSACVIDICEIFASIGGGSRMGH